MTEYSSILSNKIKNKGLKPLFNDNSVFINEKKFKQALKNHFRPGLIQVLNELPYEKEWAESFNKYKQEKDENTNKHNK